ncbi:HAD superfamily hydrolase (TIGR01509 family) [Dysgonomonadaceae bacterium PH5-43]|nr:HAD superfamily hydrolase (TIGR01509 family) [Dysgonomonadaceae bacterium PH5-43]
MNLEGIKNIVFDLGGVILTLDRSEAIRRFESKGLKNAADLLDPYHQKGIFLELEEGTLTLEEFYDAVREEAGTYISDEDIDWGWLGFIQDTPIYKLKMLEDLRAKGYNLYLLSNTNPVIMKWALSKDFSSEGKSLDEYFDKLYLSYKLGVTKPNPSIYEQLIADSGILASETLFIEDGKDNIEAGKAVGFKVFQPLNGEDFRYIFED